MFTSTMVWGDRKPQTAEHVGQEAQEIKAGGPNGPGHATGLQQGVMSPPSEAILLFVKPITIVLTDLSGVLFRSALFVQWR